MKGRFNLGDTIEFESGEFIVTAIIFKIQDMASLGLAETPLAQTWFHYTIVNVRAKENVLAKVNAFQGTSMIYKVAKIINKVSK